MLYDVDIYVPVGGPMKWLEFAKSIPAESIEAMKEVLFWDVRCVEAQQTGTHAFVPPVKAELSPATEYNVWMSYPPSGDKHGWGAIADHVSPETTRVFMTNLVRKVNVMPRA